MAINFRDAILAGVTLVREAIQSQNYSPGVAGWKIAADGTAEFSDLTIRSSDGSGATVVIENGRATFTAPNGRQIVIDSTNPDGSLPIIEFRNELGESVATWNANSEGLTGYNLSTGEFTEDGITDWRWANAVGESPLGEHRWSVVRARESDQSYKGGWLWLDALKAQMAWTDSLNSSFTIFQIEDGLFLLDEGRVYVDVPVSAQAGMRIVTRAGHTGPMQIFTHDGVNVAAVSTGGDVETVGKVISGNLRAGTAQAPAPGGAPAQTSVDVLFSSPMVDIPSVTLTPNSASGNLNTSNIRWSVTNKSASGFRILCWRDTNAATNFEYTAVVE